MSMSRGEQPQHHQRIMTDGAAEVISTARGSKEHSSSRQQISRSSHAGGCGWETRWMLEGDKPKQQWETLLLVPGIIFVRGTSCRPRQNIQQQLAAVSLLPAATSRRIAYVQHAAASSGGGGSGATAVGLGSVVSSAGPGVGLCKGKHMSRREQQQQQQQQ